MMFAWAGQSPSPGSLMWLDISFIAYVYGNARILILFNRQTQLIMEILW